MQKDPQMCEQKEKKKQEQKQTCTHIQAVFNTLLGL